MNFLAPYYYKNLLGENDLCHRPEFFKVDLLNGSSQFESTIRLKEAHRPSWLGRSQIYKNCDGTGTDPYKNKAVYKAISESLERLAFYESIDLHEKEFAFDLNPTTTGMAAFPSWSAKNARENAKKEAIERWAIHEFNRSRLPVIKHDCHISHLSHFEMMTPFKETKVSLLSYEADGFFAYGFAAGGKIEHSFERALVELDRNIRVLSRFKKNPASIILEASVDKTIHFFSTSDGQAVFQELILKSPMKIQNENPKILCDKELKGRWSEFAKVWRYLLEDSYYDCRNDRSFFMF